MNNSLCIDFCVKHLFLNSRIVVLHKKALNFRFLHLGSLKRCFWDCHFLKINVDIHP